MDELRRREGQHPLEEVLARARGHPFYRMHPDLPVMSKKMLYDAVTMAVQDGAPEVVGGGIYWSPSGGTTTGTSLYFPTDVVEKNLQRCMLAEDLKAFGVFGPTTVAAILHPTGHMYRSLEIFVDVIERCGGTPLPLGYVCDDATVVRTSRFFGANTLVGMPSRLVQLAVYVRDHGIDLSFEHIHYASEEMNSARLRLVQQILKPTRITSAYGSAESGVWAVKPSGSPPDTFVFDTRTTHIDVADPDPETGHGRLILTSLSRWRNPLVRYDSGDVGRVEPLQDSDAAQGIDREYYRRLIFAGRVPTSFTVCGDCHDVAEFAALIHLVAAEFQVVLTSHEDGIDALEVRVLAPPSFDERQAAAEKSAPFVVLNCTGGHNTLPALPDGLVYADLALKVLRALASNDVLLRFRLVACAFDQLERAPSSRKVRPVIDRR